MNYKKIYLILVLFAIISTFFGGTLAYMQWKTGDGQSTNVVFTVDSDFTCSADGGGDITSDDVTLVPTSCINSTYAIKREINTYSLINEESIPYIYMDLWLNISDIGQGLSDSQNFRYALTTSENSCTDGLITSGNFNCKVSEDKVNLLEQVRYANEEIGTYYLYIWLDAAETSTTTMNQTFNLSLGGTCSEVNVNGYTISYDMNGGTGSIEDQHKNHDETLTLSDIVPTRDGYEFLGWSTDLNATTAEYQAGDSFSLNVDTILYAVWEENQSPLESYSCANGSAGGSPYVFTYTGNCTVIDDGDGDWRVKFLTSGDFTSTADMLIDAFLVGGGGGGGSRSSSVNRSGGGGGGGYTLTTLGYNISSTASYEIIIGLGGATGQSGSAGGSTSAFGETVNGGSGGGANGGGGDGGSGGGGYSNGSGGTDGSDGGGDEGGTGQGTTTREFGEETGTLYSSGGNMTNSSSAMSARGANTGAGGHGNAGNGTNGGTGGSGIVVIRNVRTFIITYDANGGAGVPETQTKSTRVDIILSDIRPSRDGYLFLGWSSSPTSTYVEYLPGSTYAIDESITLYAVWEQTTITMMTFSCLNASLGEEPYDFTYSGNCSFIEDSNTDWKIKFLTSGIFTSIADMAIDVFLVGGGGGGGSRSSSVNRSGGGGGGGYTLTTLGYNISSTASYEIIIGLGGATGQSGSAGGSTSAFGETVNGGSGGGANGGGGAGGSGGGGYSNGSGGTDGSDGGGDEGGTGQGTTTREFGEETGTLYSSGGNMTNSSSAMSARGANTGAGGHGNAGNGTNGGTGGSGIVVIRNAR